MRNGRGDLGNALERPDPGTDTEACQFRQRSQHAQKGRTADIGCLRPAGPNGRVVAPWSEAANGGKVVIVRDSHSCILHVWFYGRLGIRAQPNICIVKAGRNTQTKTERIAGLHALFRRRRPARQAGG